MAGVIPSPEENRLQGSKTIVSALVLIRSAIDIGIEQEMKTLRQSGASIDQSFVEHFGPMAMDSASDATEEAYNRAINIFAKAPSGIRVETIDNVLQSVHQTVSTFSEATETGKEFVDEQQRTKG